MRMELRGLRKCYQNWQSRLVGSAISESSIRVSMHTSELLQSPMEISHCRALTLSVEFSHPGYDTPEEVSAL